MLFYTYGPSGNANPTHNIVPPSQQMVALPFSDSSHQQARFLEPHEIVAVAPAGDAAVYALKVPDGISIHKTNLTTNRTVALFRTKHGRIPNAVWSPDG